MTRVRALVSSLFLLTALVVGASAQAEGLRPVPGFPGIAPERLLFHFAWHAGRLLHEYDAAHLDKMFLVGGSANGVAPILAVPRREPWAYEFYQTFLTRPGLPENAFFQNANTHIYAPFIGPRLPPPVDWLLRVRLQQFMNVAMNVHWMYLNGIVLTGLDIGRLEYAYSNALAASYFYMETLRRGCYTQLPGFNNYDTALGRIMTMNNSVMQLRQIMHMLSHIGLGFPAGPRCFECTYAGLNFNVALSGGSAFVPFPFFTSPFPSPLVGGAPLVRLPAPGSYPFQPHPEGFQGEYQFERWNSEIPQGPGPGLAPPAFAGPAGVSGFPGGQPWGPMQGGPGGFQGQGGPGGFQGQGGPGGFQGQGGPGGFQGQGGPGGFQGQGGPGGFQGQGGPGGFQGQGGPGGFQGQGGPGGFQGQGGPGGFQGQGGPGGFQGQGEPGGFQGQGEPGGFQGQPGQGQFQGQPGMGYGAGSRNAQWGYPEGGSPQGNMGQYAYPTGQQGPGAIAQSAGQYYGPAGGPNQQGQPPVEGQLNPQQLPGQYPGAQSPNGLPGPRPQQQQQGASDYNGQGLPPQQGVDPRGTVRNDQEIPLEPSSANGNVPQAQVQQGPPPQQPAGAKSKNQPAQQGQTQAFPF